MNTPDIAIIVLVTVLLTRIFSWLAARAHLRNVYGSPIDPDLREVHRLGSQALGRALNAGMTPDGRYLLVCLNFDEHGGGDAWVAQASLNCEHGRAIRRLRESILAGCEHEPIDAEIVEPAQGGT